LNAGKLANSDSSALTDAVAALIRPIMPSPFVEQAIGALQATISVLLILLYGAITVKWLKIITHDTVDKMTKLGTNILLPCGF
jgi:hypothetical protein